MNLFFALPLIFTFALAASSPGPITLVHPLSTQFVPSARTKHEFGFTVSADTFSSSTSLALIFSAPSLPPWLSFDAGSRRLSGCPTETDEGLYTVAITAADTLNNTLSDVFTIAVTARPGPVILNKSISEQLRDDGGSITSAFPYHPGSPFYPGVRVPPNWSFSLGFQTNTFTAQSRVFYSASLSDGSALPDWLQFNNQTVTLDGVSPPPDSVKEVYQIAISGSDVWGYKDVTEYFNLTIKSHDLALSDIVGTINMTKGEFGSITLDPVSLFTLDGKMIKREEIDSVHVDTGGESWLKWTKSNCSVSGIPPLDISSDLITQSSVNSTDNSGKTVRVEIKDTYGDRLNATLEFALFPPIWTKTDLGGFSYNTTDNIDIPLDQFFSNASTNAFYTNATFTPESAGKWLSVKDNRVSGTVSSDVDFDTVTVNLLAEDQTTHTPSRTSLVLNLSHNGVASSRSHRPLSTTTKAAIGAIVGIVILLCFLCLVVLCCRRRRNRQEKNSGEGYQWEEKDYHPETPAMDQGIKMGEPPSVQMLVDRSNTTDTVLEVVPQLTSSPVTHKGTAKILRNPFAKNRKVIPKISNPIIMPSFSNAAFQAQLAAAVDSAGIVKRGTTYDMNDTSSECTDGTPHGGSSEGMSGFQGSSRASWESEAPFVWTGADTPRRVGDQESHTDHSISLPQSVDTHETTCTEHSLQHDQSDDNIPVQRSDFRPSPPTIHTSIIPHQVISPDGTEEGISIDNIHFPTDSDIAHTEASSDHEAIITTASRVDARRTLDSPVTSSPASSNTERGASPVMTTQSRLVSFGKQKIVQLNNQSPKVDQGRNISQTAIIVQSQKSISSSTQSTPREMNKKRMDSPLSIKRQGTRSPSPPTSLPSLPALPSIPANPSPLNQQRILLGVSEPFHFYPPLSISPSSSMSSTSTSEVNKGATYTARVEGIKSEQGLPSWLHFEDMELWGVPGEDDRGVWHVRVVEKKQGDQEKVVGRFALEVVGRNN